MRGRTTLAVLALVDQAVQPTRASLWLRPTRQDIGSNPSGL